MSDHHDPAVPPQTAAQRPAEERAARDGRGAMWTVAELLEWTSARFQEAGIPSPRTDAQHLLANALACSRLSLYVRHDEVVTTEARAQFRELVRRRLKREPVAYIEGRRAFHALDLELSVDPRVLIPRPETEHLVDWLLEELPAAPSPCRVLDVGTGSGAIALAIAHHRSDAAVVACDRSTEALAVARSNAERTGGRVTFVESDLLEGVELPSAGFTAIAANLPYIPTAELAELQPEVVQFEPRLALDGGADGLHFIRALVDQVARREALIPGGGLYLEVGHQQGADVADLLRGAGFVDVDVRPDYAGIPRVVRGRRA